MTDFWNFIAFQDPNVKFVVLGSVLVGLTSGLVGSFTFLNKKSLLGDAIAHAALPGVCLGFMISGEKSIIWLLLGAFISGALATYAVQWITNFSKIKNDTAIAVVLSSFFGLGILLLTFIQQSASGQQSGLDAFLIGKAAAMGGQDVYIFALLSLLVTALIMLLYQPLKIVIFNKEFAKSIGIAVGFYEFLLSSMVVLTIALGIQAVGVILMAALLITPAAAARFWTHNLKMLLFLAALAGAVAGILGAFVSYQAPNMPTGPWIVSFLSVLAIASAFFAPKSGVVSRIMKQRENRQKIRLENVVKAIYQWHERNHFETPQNLKTDALFEIRHFDSSDLEYQLKRAAHKGWLNRSGQEITLTEKGWEESKRIVRLHRLWELYLNKKMNLPEDHIHASAETMEHVLTPEMEHLLLKELDDPERDPHDSIIPR